MSEYLRYLPDYRRNCVEQVVQTGEQQVAITAIVPRSVSCPGLDHLSPTDYTLAVMQAAYVVSGSTIENIPENFQYRGLFLGHNAEYLDQDSGRITFLCNTRNVVRGPLEAVRMSLEDDQAIKVQLLGGIPQQEPRVYLEGLSPRGERINKGLLEEILDIYTGEIQSKVVEVGYDSDNDTYEAAIRFPQYSEIADLDHVSAKQMIEAIMKAAYCAAGHKAYTGNFAMGYKDFLANRLKFRTAQQNITYRKLLAFGSQSLLHFRFTTEGNKGTFIFSKPNNVSEDELPFATGRITFYLPETATS